MKHHYLKTIVAQNQGWQETFIPSVIKKKYSMSTMISLSTTEGHRNKCQTGSNTEK